MKRLIAPFITVTVILAFIGCSTKFNVGAPYKNITVIYAYLDKADTAHYIRIQKAFLDQNKSAVTMSQSPDSSFYANLNVRIKRIYLIDSTISDTIHLNRVDLDKEGYQKQAGTFFTAPNYAYKFNNLLNSNYNYRIIVTNLSTGQVDSADAPVIDDLPGDVDPASGQPSFNASIFSDTGSIDFASTLPNTTLFIQGNYNRNFTYENLSTAAVVADLVIQFNWIDSNIATHASSHQSYSADIGYQSLITANGDGQIAYSVPNTQLYNALYSGMKQAPANTIRIIDKCVISIYLGTQDFLNYLSNSQIQGTGLTGSEIEPVYTNVKGSDALGLFTSRGSRSGKVKISYVTVDSLMISPLMAGSNIRGTTY